MIDSDPIPGPVGFVPYSPDWLNGLSDAEKQSLPVRNFSRSLHDDGCAHAAWLLWSTQEREKPTPHRAEVIAQGRILVLQGFIKKTQKTPPDDVALARRRNREFEK